MIAVMGVIFMFSGQDAKTSSKVSTSVGDEVVDILDIEVPPGQTSSSVPIVAGLNIRKLAHLFLYMMLGFTTFMFIASLSGLKRPHDLFTALYSALISLAVCFLYACFDEYHQSFVDGRAMSIKDVGIDSLGFSILILLSCIGYIALSAIIKKRLENKETER